MSTPYICHVKIAPDQFGNPVTQAEKDEIQKKFDAAAKASLTGAVPQVVVTSDRVRVELIHTGL